MTKDHKRKMTKGHTRVEYLLHWDNGEYFTDEEKKKEKADIRQENVTALSYAMMWVGLASVLFALIANLFDNCNPEGLKNLLLYTEFLFLISIVFFIIAGMLFWHGSSTDHCYRQYAQLNENGDSLVMVGSLILIIGFCFLSSYYLLKTGVIDNRVLGLYLPLLFVLVLFFTLDGISVKTASRRIFRHYIIEAARFCFYTNVHKDEDARRLIAILNDKKEKCGLVILLFLLLLMIAIPLFFCIGPT